jgi:hypothetical protein
MAHPKPDPRDPLARGSMADRSPVDRAIDESMPLFAPLRHEPTTSQLALDTARRKFGKKHQQILDLLTEHGAMTPYQVADLLGVPQHTISGRFSELEGVRIEKTGERLPNPAGNLCYVYRLTRN